MSRAANPKLKFISVAEIGGYYPPVDHLAKSLSERSYAQSLDALTDDAIRSLLYLHPVQIFRLSEDCLVVAGFRSYQLAVSRLGRTDKIPVVEHVNLSELDAVALARIDILGSALMHSLGSKSAEQLGMIKEVIGGEALANIAPTLKSVRARRKFEQNR